MPDENTNPQDIFQVNPEYNSLSKEKKREILCSLIEWAGKELEKLSK